MARIRIENLEEDKEISREEMKAVTGGRKIDWTWQSGGHTADKSSPLLMPDQHGPQRSKGRNFSGNPGTTQPGPLDNG